MKWAAILFFFGFIGCSGCKEEPVPPPYLPPGSVTGETSNGSTDGGVSDGAKAEPVPAKIPATAKVELMVSRDYAERRVPPPVVAITFSEGSRIYIYAFWQGLETDKIYKERFRACPPDKAEANEGCFQLDHEFATVNKKVNSGDAIYINPLGWMTTVSFDLALADETLGIWYISVWPTDQDDPYDETPLEVM